MVTPPPAHDAAAIAKIAKGLTEIQADVLLSFDEDEARDYARIQGRVRKNLFEKDLLRLSAWSGSPQHALAGLTPLGLAVRASLAQSKGEE